jgi:hypothetical protein
MHAISLHLVLNVFERTLMLLMLNFNISKPNRAICDVKTFCRPVRVGPPFLLLVPAPPVRVGPSVYPKKELMAKRTQFFFRLSPPSHARSQIRLPMVARPSLSAAPRALRKPKTVRDERWRVSERRPSPCAARLLVGGRQMGTGIVNLFSIF